MRIQRSTYLEDLKARMHNGLIKVITGIRRCGKSYLLFEIFKDHLHSIGVADDHIIGIEFDKRESSGLRNPDEALAFIKSRMKDDQDYYVLLDEVQLLDSFEEVLNSLLHIRNADTYVTGSNSRFLSKDVITEFRGRGDEIRMFPLTFSEFMQAYDGDVYHGWAEYVNYGGLPLITTMRTERQKVGYLENLFDEVYMKDIVERNGIEKTQELEDLLNVLASSVGSLTNAARIHSTFESVLHSRLSANTIRQYLECLEDAFMVSSAQRYDVKGRHYIGSPLKYYFEDVGLRNARLGFRQSEENHLMENIIYNELRCRGFSVDVGIVDERNRTEGGVQERRQLEIDFVANLGSRRYYLQSAFSIPTEEKRLQEKRSLTKVSDSFKKIVIVKDIVKTSMDDDGILTMNVYDFLLNPKSLES